MGNCLTNSLILERCIVRLIKTKIERGGTTKGLNLTRNLGIGFVALVITLFEGYDVELTGIIAVSRSLGIKNDWALNLLQLWCACPVIRIGIKDYFSLANIATKLVRSGSNYIRGRNGERTTLNFFALLDFRLVKRIVSLECKLDKEVA
jgi:hypothetical protein